jgi:hypothetical protein
MLQLAAVTAASAIYPKLGDAQKAAPSRPVDKRNIREEVRQRSFTLEYGETRVDLVPADADPFHYVHPAGDKYVPLPPLLAASMQVDYWFDWKDVFDAATGDTVPGTGEVVGPVMSQVTLRGVGGSLAACDLLIGGVQQLAYFTAFNPKLGLRETLLQSLESTVMIKYYNADSVDALNARVSQLREQPSPLYAAMLAQSRHAMCRYAVAEIRFNTTIHASAMSLSASRSLKA